MTTKPGGFVAKGGFVAWDCSDLPRAKVLWVWEVRLDPWGSIDTAVIRWPLVLKGESNKRGSQILLLNTKTFLGKMN